MDADVFNDVENNIQQLLKGPEYPAREFVSNGATFADVYTMAADLRAALDGPEFQGTVVCLASEDKAIIAASLLASLAGGPSLLLPYAFSDIALSGAKQTTGFTTIITDTKRDFPEGVNTICPQAKGTAAIPVDPSSSPRSELLKIYTGGSTGAPKVWSKTAENVFGEGFFLAKKYMVSEQDSIVATIPPYHIYGLLFSIVLPLIASTTVANATPSFPGEIIRVAKEHKATILISVPAHYRVLRDKKLSLRLAFSSAGMLDAGTNKSFSANNPTGIVEVYGSTETGGVATRNRSAGEQYFTPFPVISWKINNQCLAIRSPYISPELLVGEDGFFTTSDRVRAIGKTQFSLQGRADTVTKVGGKRVDLEEISILIKRDSEVSDCVVVALPDDGGREHKITALIQGENVVVAGIKKILAASLEPYAQPRRIKTVKRIPVKENGKYDWPAIIELLGQ